MQKSVKLVIIFILAILTALISSFFLIRAWLNYYNEQATLSMISIQTSSQAQTQGLRRWHVEILEAISTILGGFLSIFAI
jgi:multisubunit Na+/H+ antiporter MnhG subunit